MTDWAKYGSRRYQRLRLFLPIAIINLGVAGGVLGLMLLHRSDNPVETTFLGVIIVLFFLITGMMIAAFWLSRHSVGPAWLRPSAVAMDTLKRRRPEDATLNFLSVVDQSPNGILITDLNGIIVYVNPRLTELSGYTREELMGRNPRMLQSGKTSPEEYQNLWAVIHAGGEWRGEIQDKKKNGELYWAHETISAIRNSAGRVTHYLAIQEDITEHKRVEEALQESEERFRVMAVMTGEWIWEQDISGHYVYCSSAVQAMLGYDPDEVLGKHYLKLIKPNHQEQMTATLSDSGHVEHGFSGVINRYRHKDGHEVITESTGRPIYDSAGRLIKWRGVDRDVTAHKLYEDALRLRDRAIEAAPVGIVISDARRADYPTIYVNPAFTEITGYNREELIGQNMRLLQGPDTDVADIQKVSSALQKGLGCEIILKNYRKDGTPFWNELLISPVHDEKDKLTHFIGVQSDITELKRAEDERQELEIAKQIQQSLLPKASLQLEALHIAGYCLPALQVGGDYFDYFWAHDAVDIVIADVSGHSVGAALMMAETRSTLKAETSNLIKTKSNEDNSASNILHVLNDLLYEDLNRAELFITMFYVKYNMATRQLKYANAGHNCALLLRGSDNRCVSLDAEGLVLGVNRDVSFEEKSICLEAGDILLLYTDGITEAQDKSGEFFGAARLCRLFATLSNYSAQGIIDHVINALKGFCQSSSFNDDISMVVLKIL